MLDVSVGFFHIEAVEIIPPHDDVVIEGDVDQDTGFPELFREEDVVLAGLG